MRDTFKDILSYAVKIYECISIEEFFFFFFLIIYLFFKLKALKEQGECPRGHE
jgi:hypothetical protein